MRALLLTSALLCLACAWFAQPASAQPRFGAYTPGSPNGGSVRTVDDLERQTQRRISIVHWFVDWAHASRKYDGRLAIRGVMRSKRSPLVTWMPSDSWRGITPDQRDYSLRRIKRGAYDGHIRSWARMMGRFRKKVYVRLMHEMNGNWNPWGGTVNGNSPRRFRAAWRHIVKVSRRAGAHNVRWVFSPLAEDVPRKRRNRFEKYYPGKRYVDVLGLSGYNWGGDTPWFGGWRSFKEIFKRPYKRLRRLGPQPIWITEVGSASNGGDKAKWVRKMWRQSSRWRRMRAIVWYNQDKEKDWSAAHVAHAFHP